MTQILPNRSGIPDPHDAAIESVAQLELHLRSGCKPAGTLRVGMEHEKFGVHLDTGAPIEFDGPSGVEAILNTLARDYGYDPLEENGRTIALMAPGLSVSLEPGGQLELSGAPHASLRNTQEELDTHLAQVRAVAEPLGVAFYGLGFRPQTPWQEVPQMPKARYRQMRAYLAEAGAHGPEMMVSTATVQANLDYVDEEDMGRKLQVALGTSAIITALWAASPFEAGAACGMASRRMHTWQDTDPSRTGLLRFALERPASFRDYVEWALHVPLIFVRRGDAYLAPPKDLTLARWLETPPPELGPATLADYADLLSTLFPDVRLKTYLEVRSADAGNRDNLLALPALLKGLLYHPPAMDRAWGLVSHLSFEDHQALKVAALRDGLAGEAAGVSLLHAARELVDAARNGLDAQGAGQEVALLDGMAERARTGRTLADELVAHPGSPLQATLALSRLA